jgi:prevent-host-death family protein
MQITRLSATEARQSFAEVVLRVVRGERIVLQRHGRDLAALIPMEDCEWLEGLEDLLDIAAAKRALEEGGPLIPYERLRKRLGLKPDERPSPDHTGSRKASRSTSARSSKLGGRAKHASRGS